MSSCEFEKIINDVIASFLMEGIIIPENIIDEIKQNYIDNDLKKKKVLVKEKVGFYNDYRRE